MPAKRATPAGAVRGRPPPPGGDRGSARTSGPARPWTSCSCRRLPGPGGGRRAHRTWPRLDRSDRLTYFADDSPSSSNDRHGGLHEQSSRVPDRFTRRDWSRRPGAPLGRSPAQVDDRRARELLHQAVRRLLREDAGAGVREAHGDQGQLRGDQRGRHAHPADHDRGDQVRPRDHLPALNWPHLFDRAWSTSATSRARSARSSGAGTTTSSSRRGEQEVEGAALGQHRPARGVPHRLVQGGRRQQVPRQLGGPARRRPPAEEEGPSRSASSWATASATTTAGSIRCSGPTAGARSTRTARRSSSTPPRRRPRSTSAAASTRRRCSRTCWAGPT